MPWPRESRSSVVLRLGSGDNVEDAEVGKEHGDWELRERGALVASSRKCRVRKRGKRRGGWDPQSRTYREAWLEGAYTSMVDPERTKIAMQRL
jgi:hypothetical protein